MKLAGSKSEPAPAPTEPAIDATPEPTQTEPSSDEKPFDDEPFDAGVEADEKSDPKKFIEQLTGKLGQSLRKYTEEQGQPDFELEKFAINSLLSATHTSKMDAEDQDDIIKKVKEAGENEDSGDDSQDTNVDANNDTPDNANLGIDGGTDGSEPSVEAGAGEVNEEMTNLFVNPKKNNMFQPGSNDKLTESCWKGYKQVGMKEKDGKQVPNCVPVNENMGESNNYMFWQNLKNMNEDVVTMLKMDKQKVDSLIADGHAWAVDLVATSKENVEQVYHFIEANINGEESNSMMSEENNNYMYWSNLKTIYHASKELLKMDRNKLDALLSNGHGWALDHIAKASDDMEHVFHFLANALNAYNGDTEAGYSDEYGSVEASDLTEAEYHGKTVTLGKPTKGDVKKFKVYVKNSKGNVVKVNFGDPNMEIKRDNPERRKSFRARHKCSQAHDRTTPKYWSCKMWSKTPVSKMVSEDLNMSEKSSIFEKIRTTLRETFKQEETMSEPMVQPQVKPAPVTKPSPDKVQPNIAPSRKNKPFLPMPRVKPDPKAKN